MRNIVFLLLDIFKFTDRAFNLQKKSIVKGMESVHVSRCIVFKDKNKDELLQTRFIYIFYFPLFVGVANCALFYTQEKKCFHL